MKPWISLLQILPLAVVTGCMQPLASEQPDEGSDAVGSLQVALTGTDGGMQLYRLRDAVFDIQGTRYTDFQQVNTFVESESDVDAELLRARLYHGAYNIALRPGDWHLERVTPAGAERVQLATLLSMQPQFFTIERGGSARVAFQFGVDGELIDFFGGQLEIGIGIQNAPDAGPATEAD